MKQKKMIAKTVSWRVVSTVTTLIVVYAFTGSLVLSGTIGSAEFFIKTILYYVHESFWHRKKSSANTKK